MAGGSNTPLHVLYFNVVLYALCFQLQLPLEPFVVDKFINDTEDGNAVYTQLQSWFGVIQLFGSLAVGLLLDKFGVRGAFFINFCAAGVSYFILANATSINHLYMSKIPTLFMHGFLCAQTAISQATSDDGERAANLGRLTAAYTVGAAVGPALGGFLGWELSAQFAIVGSFMSAALVLAFPLQPVVRQEEVVVEAVPAPGVAPPGSTAKLVTILGKTWSVLAVKLVTGFANSMQSTVMPLILKQGGMMEQELGVMLSAMRVGNAVTNGFMLQFVTKLMRGVGGVISLCLSLPVGFYLVVVLADNSQDLVAVPVLYVYAGVTFVLTIFQYILGTSLTAESTGRLAVNERGTQLGIEHASFAGARILAPTAGSALLGGYGLPGVCLACSGVYAVATSLWFAFGSKLSPAADKKRE